MPYENYRELKATKPFRWWYEAIIDWRLSNPGKHLYECAAALGTSSSYLSVIVNSDMFKAHEALRRREFNSQMHDAIVGKLAESTSKALDIVLETLEKKRDTIPFAATTDFLQKSLASLGYGAPQKAGASVQVNIANGQIAPPVTASELASAREALRAAEETRRTKTLELQANSAPLLEPANAPESPRS